MAGSARSDCGAAGAGSGTRRKKAGVAATEGNSAHVGLTNVDHRLRAAFGNDYGLVVETAIGAGTKVVMRVPKFRSGVWASGGAFGVGSQ